MHNIYLAQFKETIERAMYHEMVMGHLEYIGFPDYAVNMPAELIAHFIVETSDICRAREISPRFCACLIFGHSLQVMTNVMASDKVTKH